VEYPTTRVLGASPADRARDIHAAFADPDIKAVLATIGGDDQITVVPHLDPISSRKTQSHSSATPTTPTCFIFLGTRDGGLPRRFNHGAPRTCGRTHPDTMASLRAALFTSDWFDLTAPLAFADETRDWPIRLAGRGADRAPRAQWWTWHQPDKVIDSVTWGGNLEIVGWLLMAGRRPPYPDEIEGGVLILETSEEMPSATESSGRCATWASMACWGGSPHC
jgi:hypothetical protein